jgi:hypothetical protein
MIQHTIDLTIFCSFRRRENMSNVPGVEHRDPQYFGYYAQLQHQVSEVV